MFQVALTRSTVLADVHALARRRASIEATTSARVRVGQSPSIDSSSDYLTSPSGGPTVGDWVKLALMLGAPLLGGYLIGGTTGLLVGAVVGPPVVGYIIGGGIGAVLGAVVVAPVFVGLITFFMAFPKHRFLWDYL